MTIREIIIWIADLFNQSDIHYGHGTDNALDEAAYLVLATLDLPFDLTDDQLDISLPAETSARILRLARRRIDERIPVAYLVRKAWFAGLPFHVDERVLIPRSPIAELIHERFSPWIEKDRVKKILDIGTGSGCIAIACALAFPAATVDAVDISQDALDVAAENADTHGLLNRLRLIQSDLYAMVPGEKYDLIIANPPYVDAEDMVSLPAEYHHEPRTGLAAGDDGLHVVRKILAESREFLERKGLLVVEVGNSRKALERAIPTLPFTWLEFERGGEGVFLLTAEELAGQGNE